MVGAAAVAWAEWAAWAAWTCKKDPFRVGLKGPAYAGPFSLSTEKRRAPVPVRFVAIALKHDVDN